MYGFLYEICLIFSIFTFLILNYVNRCPYKTLCYKVNRSIASTFNNNYIHARPGIDRVLKTKAVKLNYSLVFITA